MEEELLARGLLALLDARRISTEEAEEISKLLLRFARPKPDILMRLIRQHLVEESPELRLELRDDVYDWVSGFWSLEEELAAENAHRETLDDFAADLGEAPRGPDDPPLSPDRHRF